MVGWSRRSQGPARGLSTRLRSAVGLFQASRSSGKNQVAIFSAGGVRRTGSGAATPEGVAPHRDELLVRRVHPRERSHGER
jgi:hypothetical protein